MEPEASPGATRQAGGITACSAAACTRGGRVVRNLMHRSLRRSVGAGVVPVALAACYSYPPLQTLEPVPQSRVSLVLSDQGRVGAGPAIGTGVARVEGALIGSTDSDYTLRVVGVTDIRGAQTRWSGAPIRLHRTWVENAYERRFSKPRPYPPVGAGSPGVGTVAGTPQLFG